MPGKKTLKQLEASGALKHDPARFIDRLAEPDPPLGVKRQPDFLSKTAKKHWPEFEKLLTDSKVLSINDSMGLAMLCEAFAEWREAVDLVNKPECRRNPNRPHPQDVQLLGRAHNRLLEMLCQFGMTPMSRTKIQIVPQTPAANKFAKMAEKKGPT